MIPPDIIALVGATATGKTELADAVARACGAEIVCLDSRQIFAELEIGTGRPTPEARAAFPHHLFGALRLGQHASAGWYARAAGEVCAEIRSRGRIPLLVGGSGLYLRAAREGLAGAPPHDARIRERLRAEIAALGPEALHARLRQVDAAAAASIHVRDRQRIGRALEVFETSGRPLSWWHSTAPAQGIGGRWLVIELTMEPAVVRERIAARTAWMFLHGLVDETRGLIAAGLGDALVALRAIGYVEAAELIAGRLERPAAEQRVNERTTQLAKRQRTWFRHQVESTRLDATGISAPSLVAATLEIVRSAGVPLR